MVVTSLYEKVTLVKPASKISKQGHFRLAQNAVVLGFTSGVVGAALLCTSIVSDPRLPLPIDHID